MPCALSLRLFAELLVSFCSALGSKAAFSMRSQIFGYSPALLRPRFQSGVFSASFIRHRSAPAISSCGGVISDPT